MATINKIFQSKGMAWSAFALVVVMLVLTMMLRQPWYYLITIFFAFMGAFTNLMAVMLRKVNARVSDKLNTCTFVMLILFVISFIAEWIAFN